MSDREAEQLAGCSHAGAFPYGEQSLRCPYCGAMKVGDGPWCFPHLVKQFVDAWSKCSEVREARITAGTGRHGVFARPETPCSFCGKKKGEPVSDFLPEPLVRYVVNGPKVTICNACIFLCEDILKEQGIEREGLEHTEDGHQLDECPTGACGRKLT